MVSLIALVERAVVARGLASPTAIDHWVDAHADEVGPIRGALTVARRWGAPGCPTGPGPGGERCSCGRRWRVVDNTPAVHHVVVPARDTCSGWPVVGVPPSWYVPGGPVLGNSQDLHRVLETRFGLDLAPGARVRVLVDDGDTHHLVAPLRPRSTEEWGPVELSLSLSRSALRGFDRARPYATGEPSAGPAWARRLPGYSFDERSLDRPWELRSVAMTLAVGSENPGREQQLIDEISTVAEQLPVQASIYTAWLWALARLSH